MQAKQQVPAHFKSPKSGGGMGLKNTVRRQILMMMIMMMTMMMSQVRDAAAATVAADNATNQMKRSTSRSQRSIHSSANAVRLYSCCKVK